MSAGMSGSPHHLDEQKSSVSVLSSLILIAILVKDSKMKGNVQTATKTLRNAVAETGLIIGVRTGVQEKDWRLPILFL